MSEMHFRPAHAADIDLLLDLMQQFYAIDQYAFDKLSARQALRTLIEDASLGRLWIISQREVVGYVAITFGYSLEFHGRTATIDELFLLANYRYQGIGAETLRFVFAQCRQLGIRSLHLEVEFSNAAGQALYRKMGFESYNQRYLMTRWIEP
ncbi:MAG TPA: GNAT family N-acetyltransferase [Ktedonobacteraceae bacterium]|nr:GNAT family N-acetyltransferase [Ktedonobacteraceae bacterium]